MKAVRAIVISLILGVIFGGIIRSTHICASYNATLLEWLSLASEVFIKLIKMIVAPLIFATLTLGVINIGDNAKGLGRLFFRCLVIFLLSSIISLSIGWVIVDIFKPGLGMAQHAYQIIGVAGANSGKLNSAAISVTSFMREIVPENIIAAFAGNHIIQIVVFSILFGLALTHVNSNSRDAIRNVLDGIMHAMFAICNFVMKLVPVAVFASISHVVIKNGFGVLYTYLMFILEYYLGLIIVWIVMYLISLKVVGKRINQFLVRIFPALSLSFATSSSEVAYPSIFEELDRFGVKRKISSFVLPMGYSFNMIGSMIYFSFAMIFLLQVFGIKVSFAEQLYIFFVLLITSKGIAGVPRASIMVISSAVAAFHFPEASILLLLPIDSFADMGRSATNVFANALTAVVMDVWEGKKNTTKMVE
jgi:Na+/H+-dicarboxylate symporter